MEKFPGFAKPKVLNSALNGPIAVPAWPQPPPLSFPERISLISGPIRDDPSVFIRLPATSPIPEFQCQVNP